MLKGTKRDNVRARQFYEDAISLDSGHARAYSVLGWTHFFDARYGWSESPNKSIKKARELSQKSLAIADIEFAHTLLGGVYLIQRQYEKALAEGERAVALNPNGAHAHA